MTLSLALVRWFGAPVEDTTASFGKTKDMVKERWSGATEQSMKEGGELDLRMVSANWPQGTEVRLVHLKTTNSLRISSSYLKVLRQADMVNSSNKTSKKAPLELATLTSESPWSSPDPLCPYEHQDSATSTSKSRIRWLKTTRILGPIVRMTIQEAESPDFQWIVHRNLSGTNLQMSSDIAM